jgi:hypothetical protein
VRTERVLQHLADPDAAIAELIRVTVPGGRVCLIDTDWESFLVDGMPGDVFSELQRRGRELKVIKPAGRQLRGRLVRAGLTAVTAEPVPIPISDRRTAETLHPFLNPALLGRIARIPGELTGPWFSALDDALAKDEFLAVHHLGGHWREASRPDASDPRWLVNLVVQLWRKYPIS